MYSRSMKGSLMALISTFLLRKAFLKTCITQSAQSWEIKEILFVEGSAGGVQYDRYGQIR